mgnify:CR=1 FL=1
MTTCVRSGISAQHKHRKGEKIETHPDGPVFVRRDAFPRRLRDLVWPPGGALSGPAVAVQRCSPAQAGQLLVAFPHRDRLVSHTPCRTLVLTALDLGRQPRETSADPVRRLGEPTRARSGRRRAVIGRVGEKPRVERLRLRVGVCCDCRAGPRSAERVAVQSGFGGSVVLERRAGVS